MAFPTTLKNKSFTLRYNGLFDFAVTTICTFAIHTNDLVEHLPKFRITELTISIVDTDTGKVTDAWSIAAMFRGFETILRGRSPETAIFLTCRSCGVCGAAHANASVLAVDMALGVVPYELGVALRNMAYAMTDYIYDHSTLLANLEGPDYSKAVASKLQPKMYSAAASVKPEL